jgi:enolase-phosphatase E1
MRLPIILTDIEGTTSSISFVKDVLFPYARDHLPPFVRGHADDPQVRYWLSETAREAQMAGADDEALIARLLYWIDEDRKATPLKALQGMIWESGYDGRDFVAHVYPDAISNLRRWRAAGHSIYVYSSGSVPAQKLYFSHTEAGDLSSLFSGYFDTTTGPKRDAPSYIAIAQHVGRPPSDFVFLSDVDAELDAAREAGMRTVWLRRDLADPGHAPRADHPVVTTFDAITL